jgi:predicted RNase H-like nuclease (RuvC/YqgF family)
MYQPHNDGRLIAANTAMDALVKLRQSLQAELDPTNEVARLKIEISGLKALVKQQEQDIAAHRHMLRQVKVVSDKVTVTKGRNEREYQHRIAQLEAKNAELTQLLKRVTPMEHFKNELRRP